MAKPGEQWCSLLARTHISLTLNAGYAPSQLPVAAEDHAAAVAHPPAVGGERRATAHQVLHGQAPGAVAQLRRGRATGRQVLHVDGPCSGDGKPQKCHCKQRFDHALAPPQCVMIRGTRWRRPMPWYFLRATQV